MLLKSRWYLLPCLLFLVPFFANINNTCRSYSGYYNIFSSSDCYDNPDLYDHVPGIIQRHIGFYQFHQVETEDGHILGLFRIPRTKAKGVVLLEHPISHDCRVWVAQENQSLPFLLWRAGFDVWLANNRGTFYSRKHKTLTIDSPRFWNFSLHELGFYDSHASVEYIKKQSNESKISVLGFSLGATKTLIYASTRPDSAESIKLAIIISSGSHMNQAHSLLKNFIPYFFRQQERYKFVGLHSSVARIDSWRMSVVRTMFRLLPYKKIISYLSSVAFGWNPDEFDPKFANTVIETIGLEVPFKVCLHFTQIYNSHGLFRAFDYGEEENVARYGQREPVLYHVGKIQCPVFLVYGEKDSLSFPKDNEVLYKNLSKEARRFGRLEVKGFNHMDFLFGKRVNGFYKNILQLLERVQC